MYDPNQRVLGYISLWIDDKLQAFVLNIEYPSGKKLLSRESYFLI